MRHAFVSRIETQFWRRDYAVAGFMDAKGGFSHTSPRTICVGAAGVMSKRSRTTLLRSVTLRSNLNATVNLMQCMLKKLTKWYLAAGPEVNPDKTKLVIFTRYHTIPLFAPPSLAKKRLEAKNSA